jgi:hypothetical protein
MSIYATIAEFGIKRFGDSVYHEIIVQAVPPHIIDTGPAWEFLSAAVDPKGNLFRTVFFVEAGDLKGTARSPQEYPTPLLILTGAEYHDIPFRELLAKLENALDRRYGAAEWKSHVDQTRLG